MRIVSALLALALAGCTALPLHVEQKPYEVECAPICYVPCPPLLKWDGTADGCSSLLHIDGLMNTACDLHREACVTCLERIKQAKVIK